MISLVLSPSMSDAVSIMLLLSEFSIGSETENTENINKLTECMLNKKIISSSHFEISCLYFPSKQALYFIQTVCTKQYQTREIQEKLTRSC